jgi:hypothetical protein
LVERLAAMREQFDYTPVRVDKRGLESLLAGGLADSDPLVRARAAGIASLLPLEEEQAASLAPLLSDRHWLVRLLAVDVLAAEQGPMFQPVVDRLAQSDPDELVRELAGLYLERWRANSAGGLSGSGG